MKLIVDTSSILGRFMHLEDQEYGEDISIDGKKWHIPSVETCFERVLVSFERTLNERGLEYTDVIMVKDQDGTGEARKRLYPEYKGKREKRPPAFYRVFNRLVEEVCEYVMKHGGVCCTPRVVPAVEADDLINEICKRFPSTTVWSSDRDLLSCPAKHHLIWDELDPIKFPVPQDLIQLYRVIVAGDASDNIPSCKGFGPKAWEQLKELIGWDGLRDLQQLVVDGRLHELAEDVPHMKKLQLLIDQSDTISMAWKLTSFMHVPAHKIAWEARVTECSVELVTAGNYDRTYSEVVDALRYSKSAVIDFETDTCEESNEWKEGTFNPKTGKYDIGVDVMGSEITGMGLKIGNKVWYLCVEHRDTDNISLSDLERVVNLLKEKQVFSHNATGFENVVLMNSFGYMLEKMVDTRLMSSYVDENDYSNLKHLANRWLGYKQTTYQQCLAEAGAVSMRGVSGEQVLAYGADDTIVCDSLQNLFHAIMTYEGTIDPFYSLEIESALTTSLCFYHGVSFDADVHTRLRAENDANTVRAKAELETMLLALGWGEKEFVPFKMLNAATVKAVYAMCYGAPLVSSARSVRTLLEILPDDCTIKAAVLNGLPALNELAFKNWKPRAELNTRSPKQVQTLLYDTLGCPVRIRNVATDKMRETGRYDGNSSTDDEAIDNAIAFNDTTEEGVACLRKVLELKGYLTRESLFLSKYPKYVHWKTGRLHSSVTQCGTNTRRYTHSSPQLGQLSKRKGKEIRDMLVARKGHLFFDFDLDSQEIKLQAEDCKCPAFLSCFSGAVKKDVHSMTGHQVGVLQGADVGSFEEFESRKKLDSSDSLSTKSYRALGKATNFSTAYLCKPKRLAHMLCVTEPVAATFIEAKALAFPGLMPYVEEYIALCQERRYSLSFMGARRHLARQFSTRNQGDLDAAGRLAWSFRIQGSAAEQIKHVLTQAWKSGAFRDGKCKPIVTIHDQILVEIQEDVAVERARIIHAAVVSNYAGMSIEAGSTPEAGTHFGSLKEWDLDKGDYK
jgi:DNA polymerase I-like protein with 3'-5' exonuclease and polymerase domains